MNKAPLIGVSRLRMGTDGHGVTTLVAFYGCQLNCAYCINDNCHVPESIKHELTPKELYQKVKKDELYFRATKGGVTFGGGEPMLYAEYIRDVMELGAKRWHTSIETSLNAPREKLDVLLHYINHYIIDIKDIDPMLYREYTGVDNTNVIQNLHYLIEQGRADDVTIRIPLIPGYNDIKEDDFYRNESIRILTEMGFTKFDKFTYMTKRGVISNWLDKKCWEWSTELTGDVE